MHNVSLWLAEYHQSVVALVGEHEHGTITSMPHKIAPHDALIDTESSALLVLSSYSASVSFVHSCTPDTHQILGVQYPNYTKAFDLLFADSAEFPEWAWDRRTRLFGKTSAVALTEELRAKAKLAQTKQLMVLEVMRQLSLARRRVSTGVEFQDRVYLTKRQQAERFRDAGYDESTSLEYPFVLQYAEFAGMPMKDAADEIIFKASLDDQHLANTELLRLRYMQMIAEAPTLAELQNIRNAFSRDMFVNPQI